MKPQDILLLLLLAFFIYKNNKNWTVGAGVTFLIIAIPLFAKHIFFTAQHLVYFAALYFFIAIFQIVFAMIKGK